MSFHISDWKTASTSLKGTASPQWPVFAVLLLTLAYLPNFLIKQSVSAFLPVSLVCTNGSAENEMNTARQLPFTFGKGFYYTSGRSLISCSAKVTATSSLPLHPLGLAQHFSGAEQCMAAECLMLKTIQIFSGKGNSRTIPPASVLLACGE